MFATAPRQQAPAAFRAGTANISSGGLVYDRQLAPSQHAWSSNAGQALEQLKKTAGAKSYLASRLCVRVFHVLMMRG